MQCCGAGLRREAWQFIHQDPARQFISSFAFDSNFNGEEEPPSDWVSLPSTEAAQLLAAQLPRLTHLHLDGEHDERFADQMLHRTDDPSASLLLAGLLTLTQLVGLSLPSLTLSSCRYCEGHDASEEDYQDGWAPPPPSAAEEIAERLPRLTHLRAASGLVVVMPPAAASASGAALLDAGASLRRRSHALRHSLSRLVRSPPGCKRV